ncbi:MAPEG family protein [Temperatibacter marinus]|uniref:MAPEG family protein n=1 Tax=Temperatibacter marinus TaxID=1456591 RepID=A0AA52EEA6_9PROT|nr:MAPEG family protein [Temperatibacter marinus]WND03135.1 MAPEG family protein [Temperatibacter marinus]
MDQLKETVSLATGSAFIGPIIALVLLTVLVWFWLYIVRLGFMRSNKIDPESLKTAKGKMQMDGPQNYPAENYNHLFEMPILFYVVCLLFVATGKGDMEALNLAWAFVATRVLHSIIHCTYNKIMHRFMVFLVSSIVMMLLVYKAWALLL